MPEQLSFFEKKETQDGDISFRLPARKTDKETSKKAARSIVTGKVHKLFIETLDKHGRIPMTAKEVAAQAYEFKFGESIESVSAKRETMRKRAKELVVAGKIRECGSRPCKITGKDATTYEVAN